MSAIKTPKSILKKPPPSPYPTTRETRSSSISSSRHAPLKSRDEQNREIALYHANLIQARKDIELEILLSIEELIEYPLAPPTYSAADPAPADAAAFKKYLRPYQPSDYDDMVVERNINEKCGYALCREKRKKDVSGRGGKFRLVGMYGKGKDFKVVERWETEKWCSEECARRALYVRVQLADAPAWERRAYTAEIDLLDEPKSREDAVAEKLGAMDLDGGAKENKEKNGNDLALERGDKRGGFGAKNGLVDFTIKENTIAGSVHPPSLDTEGELSERLDHLALEGYVTKFGEPKGDLDEDSDTDWVL